MKKPLLCPAGAPFISPGRSPGYRGRSRSALKGRYRASLALTGLSCLPNPFPGLRPGLANSSLSGSASRFFNSPTGNVQSPLAGLFLSITRFPTAHIWPLRDQMFHRGLCSVAAPQLQKRPQEHVGKDELTEAGYSAGGRGMPYNAAHTPPPPALRSFSEGGYSCFYSYSSLVGQAFLPAIRATRISAARFALDRSVSRM